MNEYKLISFFPTSSFWRWAILGFLFVSALGVRMVYLRIPTFDFHPTRQYRSALLARAYYLKSQKSIPVWQSNLAQAYSENIGTLETPILEHIVSLAYRINGDEEIWIPRTLSVLFWLISGIWVYLIGVKLGSFDVGIVAVAFFLFLPFGIKSSRSFQPDGMMLMLLSGTLYLILLFHEKHDHKWLYRAAIMGSLTVLVKPQGYFMLLTVFVTLIGLGNRNKLRQVLLFILIVTLPAIFYYGYQYWGNQTLRNQVAGSFLPKLWFKLYYWQYWFKHLWRVIGFSALVGGMFGILLTPVGWRRYFIISLWVGYFIFGLFFTYYIYTHDYYHMQFILAVSPALGFLGGFVLRKIKFEGQNKVQNLVVYGILFLSVFLNIGLYINSILEAEDSSSHVKLAEQIGVIVDHSSRTLFLSPYYGAPLQFHGWLAGLPWPTEGDLRYEQLIGEQPLSTYERFYQLQQKILPDYFIVTDMAEFEVATELKTLLNDNYPILNQTDDFILYDLREK